jgi:hypothetical protein
LRKEVMAKKKKEGKYKIKSRGHLVSTGAMSGR